jgi:transglutaminase 1
VLPCVISPQVLREVESLAVETKINKGKTETVSMTISGSVFSEYPGDKVYLKFTIYLAVIGTSQVFAETRSIAPDLPPLKILAPSRLALGAVSQATVVFKNPLSVKMENIVLTVEGDGLLTEDIENVVGTIDAGATFSHTFDIVGMELGKQELVAGLDSSQVELVAGVTEVVVDEGVEETDPPTLPEAVKVTSVERNISVNKRVHHTDAYDMEGLVLRRGQLFSLTLHLAKPISAANLVTTAMFTLLGSRNRSIRSFEVATVSKPSGTVLTVELTTPSDAGIGRYKVLLKVGVGENVTVVSDGLTAVLLFNPWNSEDKCYYSETRELAEYVLNTKGRIWVGNADSNYGRPWQFAQFTPQALDVAMWMLERLPAQDRADPIKVSRHISAMVNVQDDSGVLVGNWSGDYSGGDSPLSWTGSAEILAQFAERKKPVRYAQCWVFSGVQTSLLRCVGLPARSISNFNSAHDTEFNRAVDRYYTDEGERIDSGDSIWNFHVWNESWMARPDLPPGFGGWQVLDATPQEESPQGGGFRLGPCSVRAVKLGQRMNYDVEFVISEVNADIRTYIVKENGEKVLSQVNTSHVGKNISTKAVGRSAVNIVTNEYKFREGSTSERAALLASEVQSEVEVGISVDKEVLVGHSFTVVVKVTNKTRKSHDYRVRIRGRAMLYTGIAGQVVKSSSANITVKGNQSGEVNLTVTAADYLKLLEGGNFIHFVAMVNADNDVSAVETHNLRLKTPDISIILPPEGLKLYQPASLKVSFRNPLSKPLYNGRFELLGETYVQRATVNLPLVPSSKHTT